MRILTIGGYGFTQVSFLSALQEVGVDTLVDVRQRRGLRGSQYAFLNSKRLQASLADRGIRYWYARELAPTSAVRAIQQDQDILTGTAKRQRTVLAPQFVDAYRHEVLASFEASALLKNLESSRVWALFCVEADPGACHRSLAAEYLSSLLGSETPVDHLRP